eukprot:gene23579-biopygen17829
MQLGGYPIRLLKSKFTQCWGSFALPAGRQERTDVVPETVVGKVDHTQRPSVSCAVFPRSLAPVRDNLHSAAAAHGARPVGTEGPFNVVRNSRFRKRS